MTRSLLLAVLATLVALAPDAQTCSTSWTNAAGGAWSDAGSWDNGVPTSTSDACITLDATYAVTLDVNASVASLTLGTAAGTGTQTIVNINRMLTMADPSAIQASGVYAWQGGTTTAPTLTNDGRLEISGAGTKDIGGGATIRNQAVTTFDGTGVLRFLGSASTFVNASGATFDLLSDADFSVFNGGNTFTNDGLFRKTGGTGTSQVSQGSLDFDNGGTVEAQTGTLQFSGDGTHTDGVFTAAASAEVFFNAGTHTIVGSLSGTPDGIVRLDAGVTFVDDGAGATLAFGGSGLEWQSGSFNGTLTNTGLLRLTTGGTKDTGSNATITNTSLVEMTDTGLLRFTGGSVTFVNAVGATFDIQSDADFSNFNGGNVFANAGLLQKTGGTDVSVISNGALAFDNAGTVEAQTGTLQFDGGGTHTDGVFTAGAGAEVFFNAGTHTVVGTLSGTPDGIVRLDAGATLTGGTLDVGGSGFEWQGGNVGTLTNTGLLRLTTGGTKDIIAGATVTNTSLVEMTDTGVLRFLGSASAFVNASGATFDLQSDAGFSFFNGGNTFTNEGLFRKTGGSAASLISRSGVTFTNADGGVVSAESGTLDMDGVFVHADGALIQGTATVDVTGATFTHDGDTGPGASPGVLAWTGAWAPSAASALRIEIGGSAVGTDYDQLAVTSAASLAGDLVLSVADGSPPSVGDSYTVLTAASISGDFDTVEAPDGYAVTVTVGAVDVVVTVDAVGVSTTLTGAEGWRMLAPSVSGSTVDDLVSPLWTQGFPGADVPNGVANVYTYDEMVAGDLNLGYQAPGNQSDPLALGTGLFVYVFADDDYSGPEPPGFPKTLVQSGTDVTGAFSFSNVTYSSTSSVDDDGWNLIGNPYAATMDWNAAGWVKTNIDNTLYVWDPATADYQTTNGVVGSLAAGLVAPAQGAWVHATGAPTLTAPAAARTTGGDFVGRQALTGTEAVVAFSLAEASESPLWASAHVLLTDGAADGHDRLDGYELAPLAPTALALFTERLSDGQALDIQALGTAGTREIALGVAAWRDGEATDADLVLTWPEVAGVEGPVTLLDRVTGETVDLRTADRYAFRLQASATTATPDAALDSRPARLDGQGARFVLRLGLAATSGEETASPSFETALTATVPNPFRQRAEIRYTLAEVGAVQITVHDMLGREVARVVDGEQSAGAHSAVLDARDLASGVYTVRMTGPSGFVATRRVTVVR